MLPSPLVLKLTHNAEIYFEGQPVEQWLTGEQDSFGRLFDHLLVVEAAAAAVRSFRL